MNAIDSISLRSEIPEFSVEFDTVPVTRYSYRGCSYIKNAEVGMPRIPDSVKSAAIYLFDSKLSALVRKPIGGTGFLVSLASERHRGNYIYAVTNAHVIQKGYSCISVNTKDGETDVFELDPADWCPHGSYDISITKNPLNIDNDKHDVSTIPTSMFASDEVIKKEGIGIGDDLFMVGRFVDSQGVATNNPTVRFGNISAMPTLLSHSITKKNAPCYIVDMHSRDGYSGSAVFMYRTMGTNIDKIIKDGKTTFDQASMWFLGIHFSQFNEPWKVEFQGIECEVKGLSGMTKVDPASGILELLNLKELKDVRDSQDELKSKYDAEDMLESATPHRGDEILKRMLETPPAPKTTKKPKAKKTSG